MLVCEVLERASSRVTPSRMEYLVGRRYYRLLEKTLSRCPEIRGRKGFIELEGSFAKDTFISGSFDLDVFVFFPKSLGRNWVLEESKGVLERCLGGLPYKVDYAQHPYLTVVLLGLEANVVPVLRVDRPGETRLAVERTPFHTRYVRSRLTGDLKRDVRLFKSFLKGVGVYGAEVRVGGFSGYLAELIVIHYGGFIEALEAISRWRPPVTVDMEWGSSRDELLGKFRDAPLVWVDPVDPSRNAGAAVRMESLARLVLASKRFFEKPCDCFFHYAAGKDAPVIPDKTCGAVLVYRLELTGLPEQTVYGEMRRLESTVRGFLRGHGYRVVYTGSATDLTGTVVIAVEVDSEKPTIIADSGPEPWRKGAMNYVNKRLGEDMPVWIGWDGRLYSYRRRKHSLHQLLDERWREYTVPPHFRNTRPLVYKAGLEPLWIRELAADAWRRRPGWL